MTRRVVASCSADCTHAPWSRAITALLCGALLISQFAEVAAHEGAGKLRKSPEALQSNNVIVQYGQPRTASTFQTKLLELVGRVRANKSGRNFTAFFHKFQKNDLSTFLDRECDDSTFCLIKTHGLRVSAAEKTALFDSGRVFLFTSRREGFIFADNIAPLVKHEQMYDTFLTESLYNCVAHYQPIFDLTDYEVLYIQEFLKFWQITRKCCGFQSSRDWMNELHNMSAAPKKHPGYALDAADCGVYDLPAVERRIQTSMFAIGFTAEGGSIVTVPTEHLDGTFCERTNQEIAAGADFNNKIIESAQKKGIQKRVAGTNTTFHELHTWR